MLCHAASVCAATFARLGLVATLSVLALIVPSTMATAQEKAAAKSAPAAAAETVDESGYKVLPAWAPFLNGNEGRILENNVRTKVKNVVDGRAVFSENKTTFDAYFNRHYFPLMTRTDEKSLSELAEDRARFFRDYLESAKDQEVHEHVVDLAITNLTPIIRGNFHPAVRYNALMIIGGLNITEAVRIGAAKATPEPHLRALPILYGEFVKADNPDLLKVAALLGLMRHLEWDAFRVNPMPPAQRAAVVKALLDQATQVQPPEGRSEEGHIWMRRRAIEALGYAGSTKAEQPVVDAMAKMIGDENDALEVRVAAANALGRMTLVAPVKIDVAAMSKDLGHLAVLACMKEMERVTKLTSDEEERKKILAGAGSGSGYGGYGGYSEGGPGYGSMMGDGGLLGGKPVDPKGYRIEPLRRRMRAHLYGVQTGLIGPPEDRNNTTRGAEQLAKTPAEKTAVKAIREKLEDVIVTIESASESDLKKLEGDLRLKLKPLDDLTRRAKPAAAPAADDPGEILPGGPAAGPGPPTAGAPAPAGRPAVRAAGANAAAAAPAARP